jgi:catechol 2,3-dioxygenase-like lactoylglutathione lyase family enzyme
MLLKRLGHVCILATNLQETLHFYTEVLGMRKVFDFLKNGELFGFYLDAGNGTYIEVFTRSAGEPPNRPLLDHICLEVDDIDAIIADLTSKNWKFTSEKKMGGDNSWQVWTADPSGVKIEFMQYTPESSQLTGNPCIVDW